MKKEKSIIVQFIILFFFTLLITSCTEGEKPEKRELTKVRWEYRKIGDIEWKKIFLPGSVYTALKKDTLIKSLFYGDLYFQNQWIENESYEYKTTFNINNKILNKENIELTFSGIDTYADIFVNDSLILSSDNMFREWTVDCKSIVKYGENKILIKIYSPLKRQDELIKKSSYDLISGNQTITRKPAYHYGTDFGFRYVNSGIIKPITLYAWNNAKINDIQFVTTDLYDSIANIEAIFEINSTSEKNANIQIIHIDTILCQEQINLKEGINKYKVKFSIINPKKWWTYDLGEPFLYNFNSKLIINDKSIAQKNVKFGIRKIEIIQEDDATYLKLNNKQLFLKGGTYVPMEIFLDRINSYDYQKIVQSFVISNINIVRLSEIGIYENDIFYNLCDEKGVLIWHDFMLPYEIFPDDEHLFENIKQETRQNIIKLRNHPSIAFWYGSNEIEKIWTEKKLSEKYSKKDSIAIWDLNNKIFNELLPELVKENSSENNYLTEFKIHTIEQNSFVQSYPSKKTLKTYISKKNKTYTSKNILSHQFPKNANPEIDKLIDIFFKPTENLPNYIYLSQLCQAKQVNQEVIKYRKNRKTYKNGIFFGIINDYSPVISYSHIDYKRIWKAAQFSLKNIFKNLFLIFEENNNFVKVNIVSDNLSEYEAKVYFKIFNFDGKTLWRKNASITIKPNSCQEYFNLEIGNIKQKYGRNNIVLKAEVISNQEIIAEQNYFFTTEKNLNLSEPKINIKYFLIEDGYAIELTTDKLAKNVYLTSKVDGLFDDNFFDIIPGDNKIVIFYTNKKINKIEKQFAVKTLYDIF